MKLLCQSSIAIACVLVCFYQHSFGQSPIDSAKTIIQEQYKDERAYLRTCFFIADEYMNIEQYDSAQIWLNKIHEVLPIKTNSLNNYFLITRQAEVYYYNNLQQLGLQESRRGLTMAEVLNDSLLLADSYNFLGLFYMNIDSAAVSVPYYKKGLLYTRQPPYPEKYLSLSKPHHLHGNLAEAYYKLRNYDSALYHNKLSLQKASAINWQRGMAVAMYGLGDVLFEQNQKDSAVQYYQKGAKTATQSNDVDVALVCYGGMAKCYNSFANNTEAVKYLDEGFALLRQRPNINRFYAVHFLNTAIDIYRKQNNNTGLVKAFELKSAVEEAVINGNNQQIQTILNAGLSNEKRIVSMQLEEAKQKQQLANTRFMMALIGFAFLGIGFLVYRYYQNQKLSLSKMRQKISQDLHDDIGASLSSLQIYGAIAEQSVQTNPAKAIEMVNKISYQSKEILENMSDIVWSMKNNSTSNTSLEVKIKNYAVGLLSDNNIQFTYNIMQQADDVITGITARKNILLIAKEAMNNISKYSKGTNASLSLQMNGKELQMIIKDDGIGFTPGTIKSGNGLENMEQRTKELNGFFHIQSSPGAGTTVTASFPLTGIH
jgi:signal transduction histidine kinase